MEDPQEEELPTDRLQEVRETLRKFRSLAASEGWDELVKVARAQIQNRRAMHNAVYLPGIDGVLKQQWELGEAAGMATLIALPQTIIETHSQERDELMKNQEPQDENSV